MRTIKNSATKSLLDHLSKRPSNPEHIRQDSGPEGVKQLALSDVLRREAVSRFPEDRMEQAKFSQNVMRMRMQGMSDEDIYRSLQAGTFEKKAAANDPFARFR